MQAHVSKLPSNVHKYSETPLFTVSTVPKGLLKDHSTKAGVWGMLTVVSGKLEYVITDLSQRLTFELAAGQSAVIVPEQRHFVKLLTADTVFQIDFLK